jgi:hypothetical protein
MPNGIIMMGHGKYQNRLMVIPKEDFQAFWSAAFGCREDHTQSWANIARIGDPSDIALKPPAGESKCHQMIEGRINEEVFTLIQILRKYQWKWSTKILIQNGCLMRESATNENYKHVDCTCPNSRRSGFLPRNISVYSAL